MSDEDHSKRLKQGVAAWNKWRDENPGIVPDLKRARLDDVNLSRANLSRADLSNASLVDANLSRADLREANLSDASLWHANLSSADLRGAALMETHLDDANFNFANLRKANLSRAEGTNTTFFQADLSNATLAEAALGMANFVLANLSWANFTGADLSTSIFASADLSNSTIVSADLSCAYLVETNLSEAVVSDCNVYGVSAWDVKISSIKKQLNLRITPKDQPAVYVDNIEVGPFVYLLLQNEKIRGVIDTIGERGVLILGRFTPERKAVLDAIRDKLRELGFVPMMFDFEKPTQRDFTETIMTLAGMSRFIIADITNPKSAPLELQAILPHYMIPLVPILQKGEEPFAMFRDLDQKYRQWVLPLLKYDTADKLIKGMEKAIIKPANLLASKLQVIKAQEREARDIDDYL